MVCAAIEYMIGKHKSIFAHVQMEESCDKDERIPFHDGDLKDRSSTDATALSSMDDKFSRDKVRT